MIKFYIRGYSHSPHTFHAIYKVVCLPKAIYENWTDDLPEISSTPGGYNNVVTSKRREAIIRGKEIPRSRITLGKQLGKVHRESSIKQPLE